MFMDELMPLLKELTQQPIAFLGGFVSGALRLHLTDDPVKTWLDQQAGTATGSIHNSANGNGGGPQSISID
jgi:hypothetical protein